MSSPRICLFPGTFDPLTMGHVDVVRRALPLFDKIILGVGTNIAKQPMAPAEQRLAWIRETFKEDACVEAMAYDGLTTDTCRRVQAHFILRGIRSVADFEYERSSADLNRALAPEIETVFITSSAQWSTLSSTHIREILRHGGDTSAFVPAAVDLNNLR